MVREQKIRAVLYYFSAAVFFTGLPMILTYTLGYKFNRATWTFTRTGLISLKSQPAGAGVFLNGAPLNEKTPCGITELLPGNYKVELRLSGYYPYSQDVEVKASSVARLEKILLFPLRPDVQKVNREQISWFWIDEDRQIYYVASDSNSLYRSDFSGERPEKIAEFFPLPGGAKEWKVSPDRKSVLYYNDEMVGIVDLEPGAPQNSSFVLQLSGPIKEVFWYSDNYHIVVLRGREICMLETRPGAQPFVLMKLNSDPRKLFYESDGDILYFQDSQSGADNRPYENVYRLELGRKLYLFRDFMRKNFGDDKDK
ncbi:MAG: PEGA domain-containing protein [Deltaproteobacteria bacterium]